MPASKIRRWFFSALVVGTVASSIIGGGIIIFHKVWEKVRTHEDFKVDPSTLQVRGLPEWVSPKIIEEIKKCTTLRGAISIIAPHVTAQIAQDFLRSPWISKIRFIRKEYPNRLSMMFEIRRPIALARSNGKTYMLDAEGVVLSPELYRWPRDLPPPPPIIPPPSVQMPEPGCRCEDSSIAAGIDVLLFLMRHRVERFVRISAIDVSNADGRISPKEPEIVLWTDDQVRIKWGRPPSRTDCGEVTPQEKLANLLAVINNEGPDFRNLEYADIRWDRPYVKYR